MMLTYDRANELFSYNPETGVVTRKISNSNRVKAGQQVNSLSFSKKGDTYYNTKVDGRYYKVHRIIWLMHYGEWPSGSIDHINHQTLDNRIDNLRDVSFADNLKNRTLQKNNTSGFNGITWREDNKKWRARVIVDRKVINLGSYSKKEDAERAVLLCREKHGFHENHGAPKNAKI